MFTGYEKGLDCRTKRAKKLSFSAFTALPQSDRVDLEAVGITQTQLDLLAQGQCWRSTLPNLFQDTAATNPVTTAGQSVKSWKSWQGNLFAEATNAPTYQADGVTFDGTNDVLMATTTSLFGAQNNRALILLYREVGVPSFKGLIGNSGAIADNDEWSLRKNNTGTNTMFFSTHFRGSTSFTLTDNVLMFFTFKALSNSSILKAWENNTLKLDTNSAPSASANPGSNRLYLGGETGRYIAAKVRFLFAHSGSMSDADLASVRDAINKLEGVNLL